MDSMLIFSYFAGGPFNHYLPSDLVRKIYVGRH